MSTLSQNMCDLGILVNTNLLHDAVVMFVLFTTAVNQTSKQLLKPTDTQF